MTQQEVEERTGLSLWRLPPGWTWTTMGTISKVKGGSTPKTSNPENWEGGDIPWLTPKDLSGYSPKTISRGERQITKRGLKSCAAQLLPAGTVLFTSRAPIGYVAIAENEVCTNQGFKSFVLNEEAIPDYVYYYLQLGKDFAIRLSSGTTFREISGKSAAKIPIPLPKKVNSQKLIVSEIEKQFTWLDSAVASLRATKEKLQQYRQSVLKAAFEGKLSQDWRARRLPTERIIEKHKSSDFPLKTIPQGWEWSNFSLAGKWAGGGTPTKSKSAYWTNGNVLWVSPKDFESVILTDSQDKITPKAVVESSTNYISPNSILFVVRSGILRRKLPVALCIKKCTVNQDIKALTVAAEHNPRYILYYALAFSQSILIRCRKEGTTVNSIEFPLLKKFPLPLPPREEQDVIVENLEEKLSFIKILESAVTTSTQRSDALRKSILKAAFSGKLVRAGV